jgi:hypothetical protein
MTRRLVRTVVVAVTALPLVLGACGSGSTVDNAEAQHSSPSATTKPAKDATEQDFHRNNFRASAKVDNPWYPLTPGTQYILEGRSNRGQGRLPHRVVFTVTDLTKVINGVRTIVIWDRDINEGELEEAELAFQTQDNDGNVWLLGEYPEEYKDGKFKTAESTWIAGLEGAQLGVLMRTNPRVGTSSYLQGLAPKIGFQDRAKVSKTGLKTCVPVKCYDNVLLIDEWNPLEPGDAHQLKYYALGVGNVRVSAVADPEAEELVLVKVMQLSPSALQRPARRRWTSRSTLTWSARTYTVRLFPPNRPHSVRAWSSTSASKAASIRRAPTWTGCPTSRPRRSRCGGQAVGGRQPSSR